MARESVWVIEFNRKVFKLYRAEQIYVNKRFVFSVGTPS